MQPDWIFIATGMIAFLAWIPASLWAIRRPYRRVQRRLWLFILLGLTSGGSIAILCNMAMMRLINVVGRSLGPIRPDQPYPAWLYVYLLIEAVLPPIFAFLASRTAATLLANRSPSAAPGTPAEESSYEPPER